MEITYPSVLVFWSQNEKGIAEELIRQIDEFAEKGITGFFVHARAGLEVAYLSEAWAALYETCIKRAGEKGLEVWIYDEDGWPSGFAGGRVVAEDASFALRRMDFGPVVPEGAVPICTYKRDEKGRMCLCPEVEAQFICYYRPDPHYVDLLNPDAVDCFIRHTHEWYRARFSTYFGTVIKGVFTDEPQLNAFGYVWSEQIRREYAAQYGRDIREELWKLYLDEEDFHLFRYRFYRVVSRLFSQNFTKRLHDWCESNQLLLTGHFAGEDGLTGQPKTSGDVMLHYPYMQIPGIDHLGRRITSPVLVRQVGSVARQYGQPYVLSETFGCSGWNTSIKDFLWIWGYQAVNGVNLPCLHLSAYSIRGIRKRDYPLFFSYQNSWWEDTALLTDGLKKIAGFLPPGTVRNHILVVSPIDSIWYNEGPETSIQSAKFSAQYRVLLENLLDNQIGYDVGDPCLLERDGRVEEGRLCLGDGRYDMVFVSQTDFLTEAVERLLNSFMESGGRVVIVNEYVNGRPMHEEPPFLKKADVIMNRRSLVRKYFEAIGYTRAAQVEDNEGQIARQIVVTHSEDGRRLMVWNGDTSGWRDVRIITRGENHLRRWDFNTGAFLQLTDNVYTSGTTSTALRLNPCEVLLLEVEPGRAAALQTPLAGFLPIAEMQVRLEEPNVLTLDRCRFRVEDAPFSPETDVLHTHMSVYGQVEKAGHPCRVQYAYTFTVGDGVDTAGMTLCGETTEADAMWLNGARVPLETDRWFIDRSIREYAVGELVHPGENEVLLEYTMEASGRGLNTDGKFETERNRFFFPKEPESLYIRGFFDVEAAGDIENCRQFYRIRNACFRLIPETPKTTGDLTPQGVWFYRGAVTYTFRLPRLERAGLLLPAMEAPVGHVTVNGRTAGSLAAPPFELDLTPFLTEEDNEVCIRITASNRNALGPHHHVKGELRFVGVHSFKGERGFEDFIYSDLVDEKTWSDAYSFCPLDAGPVYLKILEACQPGKQLGKERDDR